MAAVWMSTHPEVIDWWVDVQKREKKYVRACRKVEKETGRRIVLRTGYGDESVMGLSRSYSEDPPPGWKLGWGKRDSGFMEPRYSANKEHPKEACEAAQQVIKKLNDLRPRVRQECHDRFGPPVFQMFGMHAISPGIGMITGVLWLTFGTHDYEPKMPDDDGNPSVKMLEYFTPMKLSEYHKAREDAGIEATDADGS